MSEIFNEYAKIALDKGIIKKEAQGDPSSRYSKEDISTIEALYGVKPNGKDDEKHIIEQAHPESVVIAPAYDRVNGLVENLLERQDIMAWIALKPNDGKLLHRRYVKANQDLVNELIRVATLLDHKKEEDLMKLADSCSGGVVKEGAVFTATLGGVLIWKLIAGSLAAAGLYGAAANNITISHGVMNDAQHVLDELNDTFEEWPSARGEFGAPMKKIKKVKKFASNISKIRASMRDLLDAAKSSSEGLKDGVEFLDGKYDEGLVDYLESYKGAVEDLLADIPDYKADILAVPDRHKRTSPWYEPEFKSTLFDPLKWIKRKTIGYDPEETAQAFDRLTTSLSKEGPSIDDNIEAYEELRDFVKAAKKNPEKVLKRLKKKEERQKEPEDIAILNKFFESGGMEPSGVAL